jgi:hypothetical protein
MESGVINSVSSGAVKDKCLLSEAIYIGEFEERKSCNSFFIPETTIQYCIFANKCWKKSLFLVKSSINKSESDEKINEQLRLLVNVDKTEAFITVNPPQG